MQKKITIPPKQFIAEVSEIFKVNNLKFETFVDNPQHYDRLFFESVGLGWQGKSTMSLSPGIGPWQLLGTIYTSGQFVSSTEKVFHAENAIYVKVPVLQVLLIVNII